MSAAPAAQICRERLARLLQVEERVFQERHPKSWALYQQSKECLLAGVPMHWM